MARSISYVGLACAAALVASGCARQAASSSEGGVLPISFGGMPSDQAAAKQVARIITEKRCGSSSDAVFPDSFEINHFGNARPYAQSALGWIRIKIANKPDFFTSASTGDTWQEFKYPEDGTTRTLRASYDLIRGGSYPGLGAVQISGCFMVPRVTILSKAFNKGEEGKILHVTYRVEGQNYTPVGTMLSQAFPDRDGELANEKLVQFEPGATRLLNTDMVWSIDIRLQQHGAQLAWTAVGEPIVGQG